MLKKYYGLWLVIAGLFGFILGIYLKVSWEESKFIIAEWEDDPILIICPDSQITKHRVYSAIEWWAIRGYNIEYVHWDDEDKVCSKGRWSKGIVFLRSDGKLLPDTYAVTSRLTILNEMVSAEIILPNEQKYRPRLLEHELGHAFGMRHVEKIGHIMHPIHEQGGEKFWIPD